MKFKLFKDEHIDQQEEKHVAYTKAKFILTEQRQNNKTGLVKRKYIKYEIITT